MGKAIESPPAFREPGPRLELMDELGIDRALMWPTLASLVEERLRDDPLATHAVVHALNQWMHEQWTFNFDDRIFATPVITLPIVDQAIAELEWVLERGARVILVRPAPVPGFQGPRSFALPEFDPFWARVEEAGILVGMHASDSGYQRYTNEWEGISGGEFTPFAGPSGFAAITGGSSRAIIDTVASAIGHGMLSRFPGIRIALGRERFRLGPAADELDRSTPTLSTPRRSTRTPSRCSSAASSCTRSTRTTREGWPT